MKIVGDAKPLRAVYWYFSHAPGYGRWAADKHKDWKKASESAYGIVLSGPEAIGYNLGSTLPEARKKYRQIINPHTGPG